LKTTGEFMRHADLQRLRKVKQMALTNSRVPFRAKLPIFPLKKEAANDG